MKDQSLENFITSTNKRASDLSTEYLELLSNLKIKINSSIQTMSIYLSKLIELAESIIYQNNFIENYSLEKIFQDCQPYLEKKIAECVTRLNMYIDLIKFLKPEQQQLENLQVKENQQQNKQEIQKQDQITENTDETKNINDNQNKCKPETEKQNEDEDEHEKQNENALNYNKNGSQQFGDMSTQASISDQMKCEIKQSIEQNELCLAIAVNKNNNLMISGCGENIKLWKLNDGVIQENPLFLYGHTKLVSCLVFTNEDRYFISGGEDGEIRIWKKTQPNVWQSTKLAVLSKGVTGVLFNHSSQQIISIGKDPLIQIIELSQQKTTKITKTLNQHKSALYCICMDQSESIMASSDQDKFMMIWIKEQNGNWQLKQKINQTTGDYFCRMAFIDKQVIICQQWSKPISQVFYEENGQFIQQPKLQIKLTEHRSEDENLFPMIYNQKQGILIQKHGQYVYILKKQKDDQFVQVCQPINCLDQYNYGNLTNDGNYLIIWNFISKKIQSYKLT